MKPLVLGNSSLDVKNIVNGKDFAIEEFIFVVCRRIVLQAVVVVITEKSTCVFVKLLGETCRVCEHD